MAETRIEAGAWSAVIDERGCTLRSVEYDGRALLSGPPDLDPSFGHHGAVLAPWPGRTVGAEYRFKGSERQLTITEPAFGHALHGFVFDSLWDRTSATSSAVTHEVTLGGEPGYPSQIRLSVTYQVDHMGLSCVSEWTNTGSDDAPFGLGFHPYLSIGDTVNDACTLELVASLSCDSDPITKHVSPARPTTPSDDFILPRQIGPARFSRAYGEMQRRNGIALARLTAPDGFVIELGVDEGFRWMQVFTADLPCAALARRGLAIEPQTCPPDAFNSGIDLAVLSPGEEGKALWFLRCGRSSTSR